MSNWSDKLSMYKLVFVYDSILLSLEVLSYFRCKNIFLSVKSVEIGESKEKFGYTTRSDSCFFFVFAMGCLAILDILASECGSDASGLRAVSGFVYGVGVCLHLRFWRESEFTHVL